MLFIWPPLFVPKVLLFGKCRVTSGFVKTTKKRFFFFRGIIYLRNFVIPSSLGFCLLQVIAKPCSQKKTISETLFDRTNSPKRKLQSKKNFAVYF
jgi:hypothetical protein